jgi:hypothetical protein
MTALPLYDLLARRARDTSVPAGHLARFAGRLVQSALADLDLIVDYERQYGAAPGESELDRQLAESIAELYDQWVRQAEQLLERIANLTSTGTVVADAHRLADAVGRTRARLAVTPLQIADANRQVRERNTIPASELRNELRARLRA